MRRFVSWSNSRFTHAYFVVCAHQQLCPLISLDSGLQTAARAARIGLVEVTS